MTTDLIHDRGRGPELVGTRITVFNLLPDLLDPSRTETEICRSYSLIPQQVAAARAYILQHADSVLAEHLRIEARLAQGNSPEVIEQAQKAKASFAQFREWFAQRQEATHSTKTTGEANPQIASFPTFREWVDQQLTHDAGA